MNNENKFHFPYSLPIKEIIMENIDTITLSFELPSFPRMNINPGQYFMLWLPKDDEIPISVSLYEKNTISFTICSVGLTSKNFLSQKEGNLMGLRGPFGNGFSPKITSNLLVVGGGMGMPPLRFLIHSFLKRSSQQRNVFLIQGAPTKNELLFKEELERLPIETHFCTDDGSHGFHGFPSVILEDILTSCNIDQEEWEICTCGPEKMLESVLLIAQNFGLEKQTQISLADRYIRCGFGLCGSCYLDDVGLSVCQDGPVFRGELLMKVKDFGRLGRGPNGSKYPL